MLDELAAIKTWESERKFYQERVDSCINLRNEHIVKAFEAGNRQRDIGHVCGLSESRVKHIILEMRK